MSVMLRIQDYSLTVYSNHRETTILSDINLNINTGETIGLIGQSGSGKTMLSLSIADLLYTVKSRQSGKIEYFDGKHFKNIVELSPKELTSYRRSFVSFIFQDSLSALNPAKTCGWQIDEALRLSQNGLSAKDRKTQVLQSLRDVDLDDVDRMYKSYPHELSGGQLQRVMIAMAIIQRPKLIIADEPTSSLDQETEKIVLNLIKSLKDKYGFTLLFISHDLDLISSVSDRIIMMEKGRLVADDRIGQLYSHFKTTTTKHHTDASQMTFTDTAYDKILCLDKVSHTYMKRKSLFGTSIIIPSLHEISFSVRKSEILGIVGPSGSGKSTIAKLLTGFEFPSAGEMQFESTNLIEAWQNKNKIVRHKIQIIFQNPFSSLNPKQRVGDCLREVLNIRGLVSSNELQDHVIELLESVGLSETYIDRVPHQLSGGQQQRVSIARTLAIQPELLICDECVSALDTISKYEFLDLLIKLRHEQKLTIIFISHDRAAVDYVCDRIVHIKEGRILSTS